MIRVRVRVGDGMQDGLTTAVRMGRREGAGGVRELGVVRPVGAAGRSEQFMPPRNLSG